MQKLKYEGTYQCGYRKGHSVTDQIFVLEEIQATLQTNKHWPTRCFH